MKRRLPPDRYDATLDGVKIGEAKVTGTLRTPDGDVLGFLATREPANGVVDFMHERWPERLRAYVAGAFAAKFPAALGVTVEFDGDKELWTVVVVHAPAYPVIWTMQIGSDDDEFRFRAHHGVSPSVVHFPIPELL